MNGETLARVRLWAQRDPERIAERHAHLLALSADAQARGDSAASLAHADEAHALGALANLPGSAYDVKGPYRFAKPEHADLALTVAACLGDRAPYGDDYDSGGLWGTVMGYGFAACAEAHHRGLPIPTELEWSPGMVDDPREEEDEVYGFATCSDEALAHFLADLDPLIESVRSAGLDY